MCDAVLEDGTVVAEEIDQDGGKGAILNTATHIGIAWLRCGESALICGALIGIRFFSLPSSFLRILRYSFSHVRGSGEPGVFGPLTLTLILTPLGLPRSRL